MTRQLFRITVEAWDACTNAEVAATAAALREAGLYALPYDAVDLEVPVDRMVDWRRDPDAVDLRGNDVKGLKQVTTKDGTFTRSSLGAQCVVRLSNLTTIEGMPTTEEIIDYKNGFRCVVPVPGEDRDREPAAKERTRAQLVDFLIVLLATKNARKETTRGGLKRAKLGIGKKHPTAPYEYITTISPPTVATEMPDDAEHPPTGRTVCPHLRRGHTRGVRYGPGRQFSRPRFIHATFVNADKEWIKTRVGYNVNLQPKED